MVRHSYDRGIFKSIDTKEKAYWLGFIFGDGCLFARTLSSNGKKRVIGYCLHLTLSSKDGELLYKFNNFLGARLPIWKHSDKSIQLTVYSKDIYFDLKSKLVIPPPVPENLINHFARGVLDSDGSIFFVEETHYENPSWKPRRRPRVNFSGNKMLINFLVNIVVKHVDLKGKIEKVRNQRGATNTWQAIYKGWGRCKKLLEWIYRDSTNGIRLSRKCNVAKSVICEARKV